MRSIFWWTAIFLAECVNFSGGGRNTVLEGAIVGSSYRRADWREVRMFTVEEAKARQAQRLLTEAKGVKADMEALYVRMGQMLQDADYVERCAKVMAETISKDIKAGVALD